MRLPINARSSGLAHTLPEAVVKKPHATLVTEGSVMLMKWPWSS